MKTKPIPAIITLAAAFISCVISISQRASFKTFTVRLLITVVIFLVMGTIFKMLIDHSFKVMNEGRPTIDEDIPDTSDSVEAGENIDMKE